MTSLCRSLYIDECGVSWGRCVGLHKKALYRYQFSPNTNKFEMSQHSVISPVSSRKHIESMWYDTNGRLVLHYIQLLMNRGTGSRGAAAVPTLKLWGQYCALVGNAKECLQIFRNIYCLDQIQNNVEVNIV